MEFIDDELLQVHQWLANTKSLKTNLNFLQHKFPHIENLLSKITANKSWYWVAQIDDINFEIRPKVNVRVCSRYSSNVGCNGSCQQLHLCKQFLISPTACKETTCTKLYRHSINSHHNQKVIRSFFPTGYSDLTKVKVLRASFPRLCNDFDKKGVCGKKLCGYLHLCPEYVQGKCKPGDCNLAKLSGQMKTTMHNLKMEHNQKVLEMFCFQFSAKKEEVFINLLMLKNEIHLHDALSMPNSSTTALNPPEKLSLRICWYYLDGNCKKRSCSRLHMCKEFLVKGYGCPGSCTYGFSHDPFDEHNKPVIDRCNSLLPPNKVLSSIRNSFPRVCKPYQNGHCKTNACKRVHACEMTLQDGVCLSDDCSLSHDLKNEHNLTVYNEFPALKDFGEQNNYLIANILFSKLPAEASSEENKEKRDPQPFIEIYKSLLTTETGGCKDIGSDEAVLSYFKNSLDLFRITNQGLLYVCPKKVQPCFHYWRKKVGCKYLNCPMLHICKRSIFEEKGCTNKNCTSNHDFLDKHEQKLIREHGLETLSDEQMKLLLKIRYPFVCEKYLCGECNDFDDCSNVHICSMFLQGKCEDTNCSLLHSDGLKNKHARRLMKQYHIKEKDFQSCVMLPIQKTKRPRRPRGKTGREGSSACQIDCESGQIACALESSNITINEEDQNDIKASPREIQQEILVIEEARQPLTARLSSAEPEWEPPLETDIFSFILLPPYDGSCTMTSLQFLRKFGGKESQATGWFKDHSHTFRIEKSESEMVVHLCVENIAPCFSYWEKAGCNDPNCDKLHICKQFLHNLKHPAISCQYNHDFKSQHNQNIISKLKLEPLTMKHILVLLTNRFPFVCKDYLAGSCSKRRDCCPGVHICGDFVNGICTKSHGLCSFAHEAALTDSYAEQLKIDYHIPDAVTLKRCIISLKDKETKKQEKEFLLMSNFNWLRDEAICYQYLNDLCTAEDDNCPLLHPKSKLPFAWQFKKKDDAWKMLPTHLNLELEKSYCDPAEDKLDSASLNSTLSFNDDNWSTVFIYMAERVEIRRLSTKSKAIASANEQKHDNLTEWKWYWKDSDKWVDYSKETVFKVKTEEIEEAYIQQKDQYHFSTSVYNYSISFGDMLQKNLGPKFYTQRKVIRRPVHKSRTKLDESLPLHWPKEVYLVGGRADIEASKKTQIVQQFKATINQNVEVLNVNEICNAEFFQKYQSKKRILTKKLGATNINEFALYHGTDAAVVDGICVQNFDWRLSGKHAVAYGQGSYFAQSASYSHSYTVPDSNQCRYMFVANVLAGKYTPGNSTMKRPPPISTADPNTLYDSCVNSQNDPSIFVIFERDQCYPQYLITYRDF